MQVAFCFLVVFVSGLFVTTLTRLTQQRLGFSPERMLAARLVAQELQPPFVFEQLADHVRGLPGVEATSIGDSVLLDGGNNWNNVVIVGGELRSEPTCLRAVTPGWLETMRVGLLAGRDVHASEQHPASAVVNETFARMYFPGENPVGRVFAIGGTGGSPQPVQIVGLARDALYRSLRDPALPVAYVPFRFSDDAGGSGRSVRRPSWFARRQVHRQTWSRTCGERSRACNQPST